MRAYGFLLSLVILDQIINHIKLYPFHTVHEIFSSCPDDVYSLFIYGYNHVRHEFGRILSYPRIQNALTKVLQDPKNKVLQEVKDGSCETRNATPSPVFELATEGSNNKKRLARPHFFCRSNHSVCPQLITSSCTTHFIPQHYPNRSSVPNEPYFPPIKLQKSVPNTFQRYVRRI